jgi:membrane dipeptidase
MKIIDLHQDFMSHLRFQKEWGQTEQTSIAQLRGAGVSLVHATAFPLPKDDNHCGSDVNSLITEELEMYQELAVKEDLQLIRTTADLESKKLQMLLHIEGLNTFSGTAVDWELLDKWLQLGVRSIGTHWNVDNQLGAGTLNTKDGLTELGKEMVSYIEQNNLLLDLAHMGRQTFMDASAISTRPLYVSHGNADALCSNVRNYTDVQLKIIAQSGGVVGVFFANTFVVSKDKVGTIDDVVAHIAYIKDLIGIDHIALGSDFGGIISGTVSGLAAVAEFPRLYERLCYFGFNEEEIEKVFSGNAERIIRSHLG